MDKQKNYQTFINSLIIGIFILISSIIISISISNSEPPRYQMISHGSEIIIFDTITGEYYSKFDSLNEGPHDWTKVENPFISEDTSTK